MLKLKRSARTMMKVDRKISSSRLDFERIRRRGDDTEDMKTGKEVRKTDSLVGDNHPVNTTSSSYTSSSPSRLTKHYTRHHKDFLQYPLLLVVVLFIIISWSDRFTGIKADLPSLSSGAWDSWWAYDGISGKPCTVVDTFPLISNWRFVDSSLSSFNQRRFPCLFSVEHFDSFVCFQIPFVYSVSFVSSCGVPEYVSFVVVIISKFFPFQWLMIMTLW